MQKRKKSKTKIVQTKIAQTNKRKDGNMRDERMRYEKGATKKHTTKKCGTRKCIRKNVPRKNARRKNGRTQKTTTLGPVLSCPRPSSIQDADSAPMLIHRGFWGTDHRSGQSSWWSPTEIALVTVNILWTVDHLEQGLGKWLGFFDTKRRRQNSHRNSIKPHFSLSVLAFIIAARWIL